MSRVLQVKQVHHSSVADGHRAILDRPVAVVTLINWGVCCSGQPLQVDSDATQGGAPMMRAFARDVWEYILLPKTGICENKAISLKPSVEKAR